MVTLLLRDVRFAISVLILVAPDGDQIASRTSLFVCPES